MYLPNQVQVEYMRVDFVKKYVHPCRLYKYEAAAKEKRED